MKMCPPRFVGLLILCSLLPLAAPAQIGPFDPEQWPPTLNPEKQVHFVVTDAGLEDPPSELWRANELAILTGGDQQTEPITIGGHTGRKATSVTINVADKSWRDWAETETLDILLQVYGDSGLYDAQGAPRGVDFLLGTVPPQFLSLQNGGPIPLEAKNGRWNWVLFRITNGIRPDGKRFVGSLAEGATGFTQFGGVNGGTIRIQVVPNMIVRVVAFGEPGAFGEPDAINHFLPADACDPEPITNLVGLDIDAGITNHLEVLNGGDQTVTEVAEIGPAGDKRRAVQMTGQYLNFGISEEYLGAACNEPRTMRVCLDFYDAPEFGGANVAFGPESYATDAVGGTAVVPTGQLQVLSGTGRWIRRSWTLPAVNLKGVGTGTLTGGPRFVAQGGLVAVSRAEFEVYRAPGHPLAGQNLLAQCYVDPVICDGIYGDYVELDLAQGIKDGLDLGTSGFDQETVVAEAGPENDRRMAVRAAHDDGTPPSDVTFNFAITGQALGPSTQDNARMAVCATYYDDPALAGQTFGPQVWATEVAGGSTYAFLPAGAFEKLRGTGGWRTVYWELPDVKLTGVNQGPQAGPRFISSGKIFVTRVRYALIRPCGPHASENRLESCRPVDSPQLSITPEAPGVVLLRWPTAAQAFALEQGSSLSVPDWQPVTEAPALVGDDYQLRVSLDTTSFFRLRVQ